MKAGLNLTLIVLTFGEQLKPGILQTLTVINSALLRLGLEMLDEIF